MNEVKQTTPKKTRLAFQGNVFAIVSELGQLVIILALVVIAVLSFGSRIPALSHLGFRFYTVISGSMEPTIQTGSLLLAAKYDPAALKEGDIITYNKANPETGAENVVTHRIASVDHREREQQFRDENGEVMNTQTVDVYEFTTKGDANEEADGYTVVPGEILGVYKGHVPKLGYGVQFIQSSKGFLSVVVIPAMVLIIWESVSLVLSIREWLEQRKKKSIKQ